LFTKVDLDELDEEQRKEALESAEQMIERLEDLVNELKRPTPLVGSKW